MAIVTLQQPTALLLERIVTAFVFEHAQIAPRCSEFYGIPQPLLAMPLRC